MDGAWYYLTYNLNEKQIRQIKERPNIDSDFEVSCITLVGVK
jgi:hypothetical protein